MYFQAPRRDETSATSEHTTRHREIVLFSTQWCGDCRRAKRLFDALGVPYTEIDIDQDRVAAGQVMRLDAGMRSVPTIVFPDGSVFVEPSNAALEAKLATYADG